MVIFFLRNIHHISDKHFYSVIGLMTKRERGESIEKKTNSTRKKWNEKAVFISSLVSIFKRCTITIIHKNHFSIFNFTIIFFKEI